MLFLEEKARKNLFCLDTYVIRDKGCIGYCCQNPKTLKDKIQIAIEAGYDAVELWHKDVQGYFEQHQSFDELKDLMRDKLFVASYKVLEGWFEGQPKNHLEVLEMASAIEARTCVVKLVGDSKEFRHEPVSYYVDKYKELLSLCKKYRTKPALEFMCLANTMNSIDKIYDILTETQGWLVLDTWHLWRNDNSNFTHFKESIDRLNKEWVSVIHFTDARKDIPRERQVDGDRKLPKYGCLDLPSFCQSLDTLGFKGTYSLNVYDQSLWNQDPLKVATEGLMLMKQCFDYKNVSLLDSPVWNQKKRCELLWEKQYYTHLDPRISQTNRDHQLRQILLPLLQDKIVLDVKCGFSPLGQYVTYGFDAYGKCIEYLKSKYPTAHWYCESDQEFSKRFSQKIDVLLHIGLGDSDTEEESHFQLRKNCQPSLVVLECAANADGTVNESKMGNQKRWSRLIQDLDIIKIELIQTDMAERSYRLIMAGKPRVIS